VSDDASLSAAGVEELFDRPADAFVELDDVPGLFAADDAVHDLLTLPETAEAVAVKDTHDAVPIDELLSSLAGDFERLARDIHAMLED
jgi:hypothetical protein